MEETPVVGGVVDAPGPVPGAHGTAVPLVPVGIDDDAPVLRSVGLDADAVAVGLPALGGVATVDEPLEALLTEVEPEDGAAVPLCAAGPLSVAVFTPLLDDVVVPVELLACEVGELLGVLLALAVPLGAAVDDGLDAVERAAVPTLVPVEAAPVTGTHGIVDVGVVGVVGVLPG